MGGRVTTLGLLGSSQQSTKPRALGSMTGSTPRTPSTSEPVRLTSVAIFPARWRRAALIYVAVAVPLVTVAGARVQGEAAYMVWWVRAAALFVTPALPLSWVAARRTAAVDRPFWRAWAAGVSLMFLTGVGIDVYAHTEWEPLRRWGWVAIALTVVTFSSGVPHRFRSRNGGRADPLEWVEGIMSLITIAALVGVAVGPRIIESGHAWWAAPAAFATVGIGWGLFWSAVQLVRTGPECRRMEGFCVCLALVGAFNAATQVAQGLSGFALPAAPLLGLQALCMGLLLLTVMHVPREITPGLDRMPPDQQLRYGGIVASWTLVVVPVLVVETVVIGGSVWWAPWATLAALAALAVLSAVRHLLTVEETARLYARDAAAAKERRSMIAAIVRGADHERHRVAAQLHEQAVAAYAAFVSFIGATQGSDGDSSQVTASTAVRDDLARQAEALRRLMVAVRPLEPGDHSAQGLSASLSAYVDTLYGDQAPALDVAIDPSLSLGWTTETIAFRIIQEAIHNVWRHAQADRITVSLWAGETGVCLRVEDNGRGFDPADILFESGIATMKSFAALGGGDLNIASAPGTGTAVVVTGLGACSGGAGAPQLRLVRGRE